MIQLHLIGIGTGNPDHLTLAAIKALNQADLILLPRKGEAKSDLVDLRRDICKTALTRPVQIIEFDMPERSASQPYLEAVHHWHDAIARLWHDLIRAHLPASRRDNGQVALLVWGDPSLYDSSLRIAGRLGENGLPLQVQVTPGITSVQALTAAHGIPLNPLAGPVVITTGRRLREQGWPPTADTLVVMLDSGGAFTQLDPTGIHIWWGACLGLPQQRLVAGALQDVADEILAVRSELKAQQGWVMDVYLLRRCTFRPPDTQVQIRVLQQFSAPRPAGGQTGHRPPQCCPVRIGE